MTCKWEQQEWERKLNEETNYENNSEEVVKEKKNFDLQIGLTKVRK